MNENAFVVVFPSIFAKNKQNQLISNIKKILKIQNQQFSQITKDEDLVVVEANDPVFASSAINLLFGIDRIAIARCVENKFDVLVSSIAKIGANLLLKGDQFYVKVEGHSSGYLPKDVEVAATSALIEKVHQMDCRPGTEEKHDKLIYCFITKKNAYVSIFVDSGHGGIPFNSHNERVACPVFDELSAISCLESIKQGFDARISVFYHNDSNLLELVKMINRILPRTVSSEVTLDFFKLPLKQESAKSLQLKIRTITQVLCSVVKKEKIQRVSLPLSPLVFPMWFIDQIAKLVSQNKLVPWNALSGIDDSIVMTAKEIGLGKYLHRIEKLGLLKFAKTESDVSNLVQKASGTRQTITVSVGPNNIHDILDSLKH
jgi:adenylyl- and sulfurtransferase ThiI